MCTVWTACLPRSDRAACSAAAACEALDGYTVSNTARASPSRLCRTCATRRPSELWLMSIKNMAMLSSVSSNAAMSVRVGTNAAVPRPICAVETNANKNVAMKALRAYLSVGSVRNQPRNRGENSLVPNWMMRRTMDVTNPLKASMPLPSADSAAPALPALMARVRTMDRPRPTARAPR